MLREQAINFLRSSGMSEEQINTVVDALNLKGDLISRQDVLRIINKLWMNGTNLCEADKLTKEITNMPSANQWISCDERLPEKDEYVLIYLFGNQPYLAWLDGSEWHTDDFKVDEEDIPIAWMPLPQPYKEGES